MIENLFFFYFFIACFDIDQTRPFYELMGYVASPVTDDPIQDIRICFLEKQGAPLLELLAPIDEKSPVNRILETQGVTPYHICYEVENLEQVMTSLRKQHKFVRVSKAAPACAIDNRRVAFMFRKDVGLIELVETT